MKNSDKPFLSIIIPAFNEENRLPLTLQKTIVFLNAQSYVSEIIVVNDGSKDKTKESAEAFLSQYINLHIINLTSNKGKGFAVKEGMLNARGKFRLFMDADYAVPIEFVTTFLSMIDHEYDIVIGSRGLRQSQIVQHQPFLREYFAKVFGLLQRVILGLPFIDTQCGFKLFTSSAAEKLFNMQTLTCAYFDAEILYIAHNIKMQIGEIGIRWKHDGETRLPIGIKRTTDILYKMFKILRIHKTSGHNKTP